MDCKIKKLEGKKYCCEWEDVEREDGKKLPIVSEDKIYIDIIRLLTVAQSICTHCFSLSGLSAWSIFMVWKFKKRGPKYELQKSGCKKHSGSSLFKKRRSKAASSVFDSNSPVFCTLLFATHILDIFFFSESFVMK